MKIFLGITLVCFTVGFLNCDQNYRYEKMHKFGLGRRIPNFHLLNRKNYEYPQELPSSSTKKPSIALMRQPYPSLYQGTKSRDDVRVFIKTFNYPATPVGHQVVCDNLVDCTISFISIETNESIPIILRGGAGYRHFTVVVRANAWQPLEGTIRAYCRKVEEEPKL